MTRVPVEVEIGREVAEIAQDFTRPVEVIREAIHNACDANATNVHISAYVETLDDGGRGVSLEFIDDGHGMSMDGLKAFVGLGKSVKDAPGREPPIIGHKGHGTKIYYQAKDIYVLSRTAANEVSLLHVPNARKSIFNKQTPEPNVVTGQQALEKASQIKIDLPYSTGCVIRLVEFTANSDSLIDHFTFDNLHNYIRWFTIYGSFKHIVESKSTTPPFKLSLSATDSKQPRTIDYGFDWQHKDLTNFKELRQKDERRPYNFFAKTIRHSSYQIAGGYTLDIAILFEGKRSRLDRDTSIRRQRSGGLYTEEERYGIWLCRDYIPIEFRSDWAAQETFPNFMADLRRPLVLVNCQDFKLIANRGSVGNSHHQLLTSIKESLRKLLEECQDDKDIQIFLDEWREDQFSRLREKDSKALLKRLDRYNKRKLLEITLPDGKPYSFFEPTREITLFGLMTVFNEIAKSILDIEVLDYDDKYGLDMLVRKNGSSQLIDRSKVAYFELKFILEATVNHAFNHLAGILCWECYLNNDDKVQDVTGQLFTYQEAQSSIDKITVSQLVPLPDSTINHTIRVISLKRLLSEKYELKETSNPRQIKK